MTKFALTFVALFIALSCTTKEPQPIKLNVDSCDFCKMTISNAQYASELLTEKGRIYKFDDLSCMIRYAKENTALSNARLFVNDYLSANKFIPVEQASFLKGGTIHAPMGGNTAAFSTIAEAQNYQPKLKAEPITWEAIYKAY